MPINHEFPYTNLHDVNVDWILQVVKEFQENYNGIEEALDNAILAIHQNETTSLEELTAAKNLILEAFNNTETEVLSDINTAKEAGLNAINDDAGSAVTVINNLISSLPSNYADMVGKLLIIGGILQMNENQIPVWVQGDYYGGTYDSSITNNICTQPLCGISGLHLIVKNNASGQKIYSALYFTGYSDGQYTDQHEVVINSNTWDYTFPNNAYAFSLNIRKNDGTSITPSQANVSWNWSSLADFINYNNDEIYSILGALKYNLIPATGFTDGYYIDYRNGAKTSSANYCYTDYVPVSPLKNYYYKGSLAHPNICFYDMQHNFVSGTTETSFTTPAGCYYMIISVTKADRTAHAIMASSAETTPPETSYLLEILKNSAIKTSKAAVMPNTYASILPDFDNAQDNTAYMIAFSQYTITNIPAHFPYGIYIEPGILVTYAPTVAPFYKMQFYFTRTGVFSRVYATPTYGWGEWFCISKPTLQCPSGAWLIRLTESGMPCNINITDDIDLYTSYTSEKGSSYWTNYPGYVDQDRKYAGIYLHEGVNINGNGHTLTFNPTTIVNSLIQRDFSPINLAGNNIVENLTINIGNNKCRYAIHDDFVLAPEGVTIRNCVLKGTGHSDALLGAGVKAYATHKVYGLVCLDNTGDYDIAYHANSAGVQAASFLEISGCYCEKGIIIRNAGNNQVVTPCLVHDNKCSAVTLGNAATAPYQNMQLLAWNNVTNS